MPNQKQPSKKRIIKISIQASGKGLRPYRMVLELNAMDDATAISRFKELCEVVHGALK